MRRLKESTAKRAGRGRLFKLHDRRAVEGEHSTRLGECSPSLTFRVSALSFSDGLFERFEELTQLGGERGGDRGELAGSEFAEVGDEVGKGSGIPVERGQGFFFGGVKVGGGDAGLGA